MVQETKSKPKSKFVKLFIWGILALVLFLLAKNLLMHVNKQVAYIENKISSLSLSTPIDSSLGEKNCTDLQIRDAYFMTKIAATILQNDRDIATALDLLNTAQSHLSNLSGEKIDYAKTTLAADIEKLSKVKAFDTHILQDKLTILDKFAAVMPLKNVTIDVNGGSTIASQDMLIKEKEADKSRWQQSIQNIISEAKTVIKIRKKPAEDTTLSEAAIEIKRAQFGLLVEQVRWALFYKDPQVYTSSIIKMQQLLPEIFDTNSESVKKITDVLGEMSVAEVNFDVPSIQESVNALKALLVG